MSYGQYNTGSGLCPTASAVKASSGLVTEASNIFICFLNTLMTSQARVHVIFVHGQPHLGPRTHTHTTGLFGRFSQKKPSHCVLKG